MSYLSFSEFLYPIDKLPKDVQEAWKNDNGFKRLGWDEDGDPVVIFNDLSKRKLDPQWVQRVKHKKE